MHQLRRAALLRAELEVVLGRLGPREQRAHRGDLLRRVVMGGAGDRELVVRRSSRARTSGSACSGFEEERMKHVSGGSPAAATTSPERTATA